MRYGGWYQIAFERDLQTDLTSISVGSRRLLIVRDGGGVEVFDAICPHRGADLGVGGKLIEPRVVLCPYHAHKVALGGEGGGPYCVRRYDSLLVAGLVFVRIGDFDHANELPGMLEYLNRTHRIFPGFETTIRVAPEMVIENAFDWAHFKPVHDVLDVEYGAPQIVNGVFTATTRLRVGPSMWQGTDDGSHHDDGNTWVDVPLLARAYGPNVTITQIAVGGGDHPHFVIAAATPKTDGISTVRLSVALPLNEDGSEPPKEAAEILFQFESMGLEQDRPVWEALDTAVEPKYTAEDANVLAFRRFCERFRLASAR
jgi:3-ketosteroid 9alpha-monooxygenase subunit A